MKKEESVTDDVILISEREGGRAEGQARSIWTETRRHVLRSSCPYVGKGHQDQEGSYVRSHRKFFPSWQSQPGRNSNTHFQGYS